MCSDGILNAHKCLKNSMLQIITFPSMEKEMKLRKITQLTQSHEGRKWQIHT